VLLALCSLSSESRSRGPVAGRGRCQAPLSAATRPCGLERVRPVPHGLRPPHPTRPAAQFAPSLATAAAQPHRTCRGARSALGITSSSGRMLQIPAASSCGLQRPQSAQACRIAELSRAVRSARAAAVGGSSGSDACRQRGQLQIAASLTKRADELNTSGGARGASSALAPACAPASSSRPRQVLTDRAAAARRGK
jgi:hypothetical protein